MIGSGYYMLATILTMRYVTRNKAVGNVTVNTIKHAACRERAAAAPTMAVTLANADDMKLDVEIASVPCSRK